MSGSTIGLRRHAARNGPSPSWSGMPLGRSDSYRRHSVRVGISISRVTISWRSGRRSGTAADDALGAPGAMDEVVTLPFGEMPAGEGLGFPIGDLLIHTWDLARAIGADDRLDAKSCAVAYANLEPIDGSIRASGFFGPKLKAAPDAASRTSSSRSSADRSDRILPAAQRRAQEDGIENVEASSVLDRVPVRRWAGSDTADSDSPPTSFRLVDTNETATAKPRQTGLPISYVTLK